MEIISKVKSFDFCHSDKARSLINNQTNEITNYIAFHSE